MILAFLLEEPSAREMLKGLLPSILPPNVVPEFIVFEGRQHLDANIERKLRGWRKPDTQFVIVRDQDASDCKQLKDDLQAKCRRAGRPCTLVRIACRELESWYFGDLAAVERALHIDGLQGLGGRRKYRLPDTIHVPSRELQVITGNVYQKVAGSRAIGRRLSPDSNGSHSFRMFVNGIRRLVAQAPTACG